MFTPAMRAISRSALPLLMAGVRADHEHDAAAPDDPAPLTHRLYGRSYLHRPFAGRIQLQLEKVLRPQESGHGHTNAAVWPLKKLSSGLADPAPGDALEPRQDGAPNQAPALPSRSRCRAAPP